MPERPRRSGTDKKGRRGLAFCGSDRTGHGRQRDITRKHRVPAASPRTRNYGSLKPATRFHQKIAWGVWRWDIVYALARSFLLYLRSSITAVKGNRIRIDENSGTT